MGAQCFDHYLDANPKQIKAEKNGVEQTNLSVSVPCNTDGLFRSFVSSSDVAAEGGLLICTTLNYCTVDLQLCKQKLYITNVKFNK